MRQHPRSLIMAEARLEHMTFLAELERKHELTYGETIGILSDAIASQAKYMRRQERHPDDPEKGGDEA